MDNKLTNTDILKILYKKETKGEGVTLQSGENRGTVNEEYWMRKKRNLKEKRFKDLGIADFINSLQINKKEKFYSDDDVDVYDIILSADEAYIKRQVELVRAKDWYIVANGLYLWINRKYKIGEKAISGLRSANTYSGDSGYRKSKEEFNKAWRNMWEYFELGEEPRTYAHASEYGNTARCVWDRYVQSILNANMKFEGSIKLMDDCRKHIHSNNRSKVKQSIKDLTKKIENIWKDTDSIRQVDQDCKEGDESDQDGKNRSEIEQNEIQIQNIEREGFYHIANQLMRELDYVLYYTGECKDDIRMYVKDFYTYYIENKFPLSKELGVDIKNEINKVSLLPVKLSWNKYLENEEKAKYFCIKENIELAQLEYLINICSTENKLENGIKSNIKEYERRLNEDLYKMFQEHCKQEINGQLKQVEMTINFRDYLDCYRSKRLIKEVEDFIHQRKI